MRKFFGYLLVFLIFFSAINLCEAKPKKKKSVSTKHKIEFTTRDKFILVGDLYIASTEENKPLVVLLHSYSMNAQVWKNIAQELRAKNYNVLAMDLRGHGRSVYNEQLKLKTRYYYKNDTWKKLPKDVIDSIKYVKANYPKVNCDDVIVVGADIGAAAGAIAATSFKHPSKKIVLISPMVKFKGIKMPTDTHKFADAKIFMMLAKSDRSLMNFKTKTPPIIKYYPLGGPGNGLLRANKEAKADLINFIVK